MQEKFQTVTKLAGIITEEFQQKLVGQTHGGFIDTEWELFDTDGNKLPHMTPLKPGMYLCTENYYSYVILYVDEDMRLVECVHRHVQMEKEKI